MLRTRHMALALAVLLASSGAQAGHERVESRELSSAEMDRLIATCGPVADEGRRLAHLRVDLLRAVNAERKGLTPLKPDLKLDDTAQEHALDMASGGFLSHTGSDGTNVADRAKHYGYSYQLINENVAVGAPDVPSVVAIWMRSPGHRANILVKDGEDLGVGFAAGRHLGSREGGLTAGCYWVMVVGKRLSP